MLFLLLLYATFATVFNVHSKVELVSPVLPDFEPTLQSGKGQDARRVPKRFVPGAPVSGSSPQHCQHMYSSGLPRVQFRQNARSVFAWQQG